MAPSLHPQLPPVPCSLLKVLHSSFPLNRTTGLQIVISRTKASGEAGAKCLASFTHVTKHIVQWGQAARNRILEKGRKKEWSWKGGRGGGFWEEMNFALNSHGVKLEQGGVCPLRKELIDCSLDAC